MRQGLQRLGAWTLVGFVAAFCVSTVLVTTAGAAPGDSAERDRRISVSGGVVVDGDETVNGPVVSIDGPAIIDGVVHDDVYVGRGNLRVDGRVTGDVLVVDGDAIINGRVGGGVVSVLGRVVVHSGAHVGGDVVSRRSPDIASGTVRGDIRRLNISSILRGFLLAALVYVWLAVGISVAILGLVFVLLFPRAADATVVAGRRVWSSFGWGALVGIVGPIVGLLLLISVVGLPLGVGTLSALNVLSALGYVVACLALGRTMVRGPAAGSRIGAFFAGFGILRVLALIPGIGLVVWFVASIYGLGALTIAALRARHEPPAAPPAAAPSPEEPVAAEPGAEGAEMSSGL